MARLLPVVGFLRRYKRLRQHDIVALVANLGGWIAAATLTVKQFGSSAGPEHAALAAAMIVGPALAVVEGAILSNTQRSARERAKRTELAQSLVEDAFRTAVLLMSKCPERTGGVVYLPDPNDADRLVPTFIHNKDGDPSEKLSWNKHVGCVGHVWATGKQHLARLSEATAEDLALTWKLTKQQIALTNDLKTILSTPIMSPDEPSRMVGVVSIDCTVPDDECDLSSDVASERAWLHATTVAEILLLAELL